MTYSTFSVWCPETVWQYLDLITAVFLIFKIPTKFLTSLEILFSLQTFFLWNTLCTSLHIPGIPWPAVTVCRDNKPSQRVRVLSVCLHVLSVKPQRKKKKKKWSFEQGFSLIRCVFFLVNHTVSVVRNCIKLQTLLFLHLYSSSILSSPSKLNDPFISWWPTEALRWLCLGMCLCVYLGVCEQLSGHSCMLSSQLCWSCSKIKLWEWCLDWAS